MAVCGTNKKLQPKCGTLVLCNATCHHNTTIGILLCADTDEDVAHYSVLNNNDQLFASKYLTYMPTQEELRREIEQQKEFFRLQNKK